MLKNNKEREEYIRDENNWSIVDYNVTKVTYEKDRVIPIEVTDHDFPKVRFLLLRRTHVYRIQILAKPYYEGQGEHWVTIGTKVFDNSGKLTNIYDLSDNQLVAYLREHKV